jgi:hypothetical protein
MIILEPGGLWVELPVGYGHEDAVSLAKNF